MLNKNDFLKKYYAGITAFIVFFIYLTTLAPSIMEIDSGELATVQATLGIAHPTGYPLFSIIGYLLLNIPLPLTMIFKANLLASVFCALGVWIFIKSAYMILINVMLELPSTVKSKKKKGSQKVEANKEIDTSIFVLVSSVCSGLMLAFNKTIWTQSTSVEVYSLQIFLISLIIFTTLKAFYSREDKSTKWIWFGFALALGFSNHMTTLLLLPFSGILFFVKEKFNMLSVKKILFSLVAFIPTIVLVYLFLPLRASSSPFLNWGNPINMENFFRHISGKQYQVWLFSSADAAKEHLVQFLKNFPAEFGYIGLLIGLIGIYYSFKTARRIFHPLLITFLFSVLYTINYNIHDLDSYFSTAYLIFSIFIAFGFLKMAFFFKQELNRRTLVLLNFILYSIIAFSSRNFLTLDHPSYVVLFISFAIAIFQIYLLFNRRLQSGFYVTIISLFLTFTPLVLNYADVDESKVYTYEDYTKAVLNSSGKNAIIFSYQWDYFVAASYYFQYVENIRQDITVIDKELLRRSWYYDQLKRNHPDVIVNLTKEIADFKKAVRPFERDEQFDSDAIEKCYRTFMTNLVAQNVGSRDFYVGPELVQNEIRSGEFSLPLGYQLVPDLLLFKVVKGNDYVPASDPNFAIRLPERKDTYINFIENMTASMLTYRAMYELQFNKIDRARVYIDKVKKDFPEFQIPIEVENRIK
jgi:hypothetical protein